MVGERARERMGSVVTWVVTMMVVGFWMGLGITCAGMLVFYGIQWVAEMRRERRRPWGSISTNSAGVKRQP